MSRFSRALGFLLNPRPRYPRRKAIAPGETPPPGTDQSGANQAQEIRPTPVRLRDLLTNLPLMAGGTIILGLFLVVLFGPLWAPENPYIAGKHIIPHFDPVKDEWISPPLAPSAEYPLGTDEWGNDILSMLLYGTRNTLIASAFITMVRVILGLLLGGYAGWNESGVTDQLIMGAIGIILSIPMLISSMILIFALDIRKGLPVFIIALSVIGWTEIAQYIRSEFIILRKMPFIEGARAVGARSLAIAIRHVLPNLLPQILVITFLELGAVLTLLGELAFIGVFIGGGGKIALGDELTGIQVITQSQVPEWGAMLAEGYRWLRAKPFIVFPPALAFFIAVLGLNAFGEGLRRLIEIYHVSTNFLLRKRMLVGIAGLTFATVFIINNTGPAPWFEKVARAFDGSSAYDFTKTLATFNGRGAGQEGGLQAAEFIAQAFEEFGVRPGWHHSSYTYPFKTRITRPVNQPELAMLNQDGTPLAYFTHQVDFGYMTAGHAGSGVAENRVTFVGFEGGNPPHWEEYQGLDLRERIVLVWDNNAPEDFVNEALIRGARGVLWVVGDGREDVRSQIQVADDRGDSLVSPTIPVFLIRPQVAQAILDQRGLTTEELLAPEAERTQSGRGWFAQELDVGVRMSLELEQPTEIEIPCILGYLPGSDYILANQMVVLVAEYDGLGVDPDGTVYQGINQNASGLGVMLELARLWQQEDLNPRRMVLFIAWGAGSLENPGLARFLQDSSSFNALPANNTNQQRTPHTIIQINNAGAGGEALSVSALYSPNLVALLEDSARQNELEVELAEGGSGNQPVRIRGTASALISWSQGSTPILEDTLSKITPEKLQALGETLSLALTKIVRENSY